MFKVFLVVSGLIIYFCVNAADISEEIFPRVVCHRIFLSSVRQSDEFNESIRNAIRYMRTKGKDVVVSPPALVSNGDASQVCVTINVK